jgi:hypothetical protein
MQYNKIIDYFSSEEKMLELLKVLKEECFDVIDDYTAQIIAGTITTSEEMRKAKSQLVGIFSYLQPIYSKALSLKKQEEYRYFSRTKNDSDKNEKIKFSAATTELLAKDYVKIYRDIRDVLCGYLKSAEALIYDFKDGIEQNRNEYQKQKTE